MRRLLPKRALDQTPDHHTDSSPAERYQRKIVEISELAGGLAHELRNPLSTMMINLKLLAEDLGDDEANPDDVRRRGLLKVEVLRRQAERLQSLFDEFLNLTGPCRLQRSATDLNTVVDRLVEFIDPLARSNNITLQVSRPAEPLICPVDEQLLSQALLNAVVNAQEAMPEGGTLGIRVRRDGDNAVICVSDTGGGIAEEDRERILRPFFSTKATGTGLGLSITRRIAEEHGGSLDFDSKPGEGTEFRIRLPLEPIDDVAHESTG